jgi:Zn-dependent protease with chaperone function
MSVPRRRPKRRNMMMSHKLALISVLSLLVTQTTTASPGIVDLALQSIGAGSVTEMKSRILSLPFSVYGAADYRQAIASLPPSIRASRVSGGNLLRRVESIIRPVLELHHRSDKIELFLYQDQFPQARVWLGCVLVISDALAAPLHDDELAGIVAHEMGHAYFMIETIKARDHGDRQALRIVELKCDAVAIAKPEVAGP